MLRRLVVLTAVVAWLLVPSTASAQFGTPRPGSEIDRESTGRTPRQPRTSAGEEPAQDGASPAPVADEPAHTETGPAAPDPLDAAARSRVRSHVDVDRPMVALTLDDGYDPDPRVLELVESYGIHGTAFIVGGVADSNPSLLNELARLGWLVCSHTYDHEYLPGRGAEAVRSTIVRGMEAVERIVGYRCPYFRAPFGAVDSTVVSVTDALGLQIIGWEASLSDSAPKGTDPDLQLSIAQKDLRPGSIVLGHFGGTNSYEVLSRLLAWLSDEGYGVGSVTELIDGNISPLGEIGTTQVTVDLANDEAPAERPITRTVAPVLPRDHTIVYLAIGALLFKVPRPRRRRRLRTKAAGAESWRGELHRLAADLGDTVPAWELPAQPHTVEPHDAAPATAVTTPTTEGWT